MLEDTIKKYLKRKIKHFDDSQDEKDEAINYAKRNNLDYYVIEPEKTKIVKKSYSDNFLK